MSFAASPLQAEIRFGLGLRPDRPPPADPLAWLDAQLEAPDRAPPAPPGRSTPGDLAEGYRIWAEQDAMRPFEPGQKRPLELYFVDEASTALGWRIDSEAPYRERLVAFWTNHFTVSKRGGTGVTAALPDFVRHAIRPHVTGRFTEMLLAVERHPAMLSYLNQNSSVGPNSRFGRRSGRGLNENLAREILELHTVSPAAGYTQADVTAFARLITGWGVQRNREPFGAVFRIANHEPGAKTLMGRRFEEGEAASEAALRFLAEHPATHRHLAAKLARHFVADDPPPAAVARIEAVLRDTGGDLLAVSRALPRLPEAWAPPLGKLRAPQDYIVAALRACGAEGDRLARFAFGACHALNQPLWVAQQPNGWPDLAQDWLGPEPLLRRLDWAYDLAGRFTRAEPVALLEAALGPLASAETRAAVRRAGAPRDAIALLLASPEFQRR